MLGCGGLTNQYAGMVSADMELSSCKCSFDALDI